MKKFMLFCLILILALGLCACTQSRNPDSENYVFPEGTTLLGTDLNGLSQAAALEAVQAKVAGYNLELSIDGVSRTFSAKQLGVICKKEPLNACIDALAHGTTPDQEDLIAYNEGKLRLLINQNFNHGATEPSVVYDEAAGAFVLVPDAIGQTCDPIVIADALADTITALEPQVALTGVSEILQPARTAQDPEVTEGLAAANKMLSAKLTYTFTPDGTTYTHEIPADMIRSFIGIDADGITPILYEENIQTYVSELSEQYCIEGSTGKFMTTAGETVNLTVAYNGNYVDIDTLVADISESIREGRNETRTAPFAECSNLEMPYGGTYIEIDLTSQHLWFYKDGTCIVSTDLVSGKVVEKMCTPTGVFSIYQRKAGAWLTGEDYSSYVDYWMPFYGGYGLHDATWRSSFGGTIYVYGGSHGCVNLPHSAAAKIFDNVTVGTKVILYGGYRSVAPIEQQLSGTGSYSVADDAGSFTLNVKAKYAKPVLTYSSSNPAVATVSSDGTVTIKGPGTATITVSAAEYGYYTTATTTITVSVHSPCDEGRHKYGTPTQLKAPGCQPGLERVTCSSCNFTAEQEIKPIENHSFGDWVTTKAPTCGAEGTRERTCTKCNTKKETESIAATGSHTEGDWAVTQNPTCVAEGTKQTKCTVCGTTMRTESIPVSGEHTPGDWQTTQDATCTSTGTKVRNCTSCGTQLETASIDQKSHSYDGPSCSSCGASNPNYTTE